MDNIQTSYDTALRQLLDETVSHDIHTDDFLAAAKNFRAFSEVRPLLPEPEPEADPVPVTRWQKAMARAGAILDNETTRTLIKAGGAFAGVGLVVWSTVHKDHVMQREALSQANQRIS